MGYDPPNTRLLKELEDDINTIYENHRQEVEWKAGTNGYTPDVVTMILEKLETEREFLLARVRELIENYKDT